MLPWRGVCKAGECGVGEEGGGGLGQEEGVKRREERKWTAHFCVALPASAPLDSVCSEVCTLPCCTNGRCWRGACGFRSLFRLTSLLSLSRASPAALAASPVAMRLLVLAAALAVAAADIPMVKICNHDGSCFETPAVHEGR